MFMYIFIGLGILGWGMDMGGGIGASVGLAGLGLVAQAIAKEL